MNFDEYIKQSIVSAIMQELPRVDTDALKKEVQAKLVAAMSPECQAVYAKTPNALSYRHASRIIDGYHGVNFVAGDVTEEQFEAIMKPYQNVYDERASIRSKLEAAINGIRTRKQFIDRFPEFSQHAPSEHGTCDTLPAIANIVADLVKLGWEPKVTKADHADKPTTSPPDRIAQLEAANTNLFEQGQKMHKRIQELEMDCKIGAQEMVKAYEEIDNLKAQVSWQKPVAWCQLGLDGKSIAYFDGKPMIMTGHVGNQHHPTPLFTAQPRKAVKLSDSEILAALEVEYVSSAQNRHLFLSDARTIEAAVLKANGIEP